ncbi:hypothetical protein K490DRAFT_49190 [Saccharata proteae CBS 121410]|uniref:Alpha N-terminal protein methyltransferase 1 n=1 Tax=Saccharata proteae CBS 121410 TaxID=1314787 RepID=A0A9P4HMR0_9PEZI|nr:hypothetical protein K490DRAFT_49190 [Saccharata proteae CBS 121410]
MSESSVVPADASIDHAASISYWNSVSPSVDGMLGGFPHISRIDLRGSQTFLAKLRRSSGRQSTELLAHAVDCGAGIGRVTFGFLLKVAQTVDIVEPIEKFTQQLQEQEGAKELIDSGRIGTQYNVGLETWDRSELENQAYKYDLIWNQWCVGHLTDSQLVAYFQRCKRFLASNGWIVVKENLSTDAQGDDIYDEVDSSVTRTDEKFRSLFAQGGLKIVATEIQRGFPNELYPVRMYALRPEST